MVMLCLFDVPFTATHVDSILQEIAKKPVHQGLFTTFINPHTFYLVQQDPEYRQMLSQFDMVLPDGVAVQKAAEYFLKNDGKKISCERISFDTTSLAMPLFEWAQKEHKKIIFVGGKPGVTKQASDQIKKSFPELQIIATLDGYQSKENLVTHIIDAKADIVICGMGAPHQEKLLLMLKEKNWHGIGFTCGGYFDQLINGLHYYPAWVDRFNIRFLYRLFKEPKRLWRRYLVEYRIFLWHCVKNFLIN
ncbi:MAG: N-acetylglucosaminyldiphosphoundecaprenol N-acetyl-beta-D-mannosaminyltransferase [Dasania sp.]|jgi:N-acetylglucosaminyldiphosphoundecaprenol N-acetyl-beta-D-mannosaminyltransferase